METGGRIVWGSLKRQVGPREASRPLPPTLTLAAIGSDRVGLGQWEGRPWKGSLPQTRGNSQEAAGARSAPQTHSRSPARQLNAEHLTSAAPDQRRTWPAPHLTSAAPDQRRTWPAPPTGCRPRLLTPIGYGTEGKPGSWEWLPRLSISGAGTAGVEGWIRREPGEWGAMWTQPGGSRGRKEKAPEGSLSPPLPGHRTVLHCAFSRRAVMLRSVMQRGHSALTPVAKTPSFH